MGITVTKRILTLLFLVFSLPAYAQQTATPAEPVVVTTGEGLVQAVPDRAWINISAESRAATAREAQKRNTDAMTPVLSKLKSSGIAADAIRTIAYDVQYEWDFVNGKRVGKGYVARNTVEVRVDSVDRVGEYLELAVASEPGRSLARCTLPCPSGEWWRPVVAVILRSSSSDSPHEDRPVRDINC